ncbi:universal stress protein [Muricauda oceani]|uniref:Universal stress protein n=1 Tax=Flagellimonas oceani TaxID=2698672 RepID=A0A6G7J3R8_9FLAO|nr:universal stress protein [Allomuricauda oceani]MBW8242844.1 universal stress protein [Allomuricauda oceani]QII45426.1 universal stress protein [Allomuricauda oceani]|tara:strand:+ start:189 stop:662 length:474 start_codon:yes stop_codon:yes gene_type:complete
MRIVLAIDGSDFSKTAIDELAALPLPSGTEVRIISVFESPVLAAPGVVSMGGGLGNYYEEALSQAKKSTEEIVDLAVQMLREKNPRLSVTTAVVNGWPKNVILEEAEAFNADLIIVGSQGRGAVSRFLLGSVSQSVAMHARCSVMIVRKRGMNKKDQ